MKKLPIFTLLMYISLSLAQENPNSFSLQDAIDYAPENNREAKNASRDVEAAKKRKWETIAKVFHKLMPQFLMQLLIIQKQ